MTDIDIDRLEALQRAATPAPWDGIFLAELLNAAPALIAEVRRLRAIEAAARAYCDLTPERADETPAPLLFAKLQAALAAKEDGK
jgi:hypothetical protein